MRVLHDTIANFRARRSRCAPANSCPDVALGTDSPWRHGWQELLFATIGAVLAAAAGFKFHAALISTTAAGADESWLHLAGQLAPALFEAGLAGWMLFGRRLLWPARIALCAFVGLSSVAFYKLLRGDESCGCFGEIRLNPAYVLAFDLAAVVALIHLRASDFRIAPRVWPVRLRRLAAFAVLSLCALLAIRHWPVRLEAATTDIQSAYHVVLKPESWIGHPLPLSQYIDQGQALERGDWIVVFHSDGCSMCREAVPKFEQLGDLLSGAGKAPRFALVEMPPFANPSSAARQKHLRCVLARLSDSKRWSVPLPTALRVSDGRVTAITNLAKEIVAASALLTASGAQTSGGRSSGAPATQRDATLLRETACGPLSLIAVLKSLGVELTERDEETMIDAAESRGTNLLQLKELAEKFGMHAFGADLSLAALRRLKRPAVVFVDGIGFAAVIGFRPGGVVVVRPLRSPRLESDEAFERSFGKTGHALIVSDRPSPNWAAAPTNASPVSGPRLRPASSLISTGRIYQHVWSAGIDLYNDGDAALTIHETRPSQVSTTVSVSETTVAPGGKTRLVAAGRREQTGSFTEYVVVTTNDPNGPIRKIPIRGYLDAPIAFSAPAVIADGLVVASGGEVTIPAALAEQVTPDSLLVDIDPTAPFALAEIRQLSGRNVEVILRLADSAKPGLYRFPMTVRGDATDSVATSVNVTASVVPRLRALPGSVWIRDDELQPGSRWSRRIRVDTHAPVSEAPSISWLRADWVASYVHAACEQPADGQWLLVLTPNPNGVTPNEADSNTANCLNLRFPGGESCILSVTLGNAAVVRPTD
jgi:hypothetical protein